MLRRSTRLSGGSLELELRASLLNTNPLRTMSANTNAVLQRTVSSSGSKRKADDEGLGATKKKTTKRKPASGLIINQGPGPLVRTSSALGHAASSTSRPPSALAQHPRTSHTPPTSDGESSRRPHLRQPPPSPPVPAVVAARARGDSIPPVDPTPVRAPSRTSVSRAIPQPQSLLKGKGKARIPGLGIPGSGKIKPVLEEDPEVLENERWMAGQRSELDARERDNQRRAGNLKSSSRTSPINFASSAMDSTPVQRRPNKPRPPALTNQSASSSSVLSRAALDSVQPVPISDTPVIVRNREIRQASQSRRRSSLSSRGKRASQSLSSGLLATPHPSVPPDTFYRHVDQDLPDALRLRQVLCWTTSRASETSKSDTARSTEPLLSSTAVDLLKSIQNASMKKIASGQLNTAVGAPKAQGSKLLPPHPQNVTNAQAISRLEAYNQACQAEDSAWSELISAYNSQQATVVAALATGTDAPGRIDGEVELGEEWRKEVELVRGIIRQARAAEGTDDLEGLSDGEKELVGRMRALESKMDHAYESAYRASQFASQASTHLGHVFSALAKTLRQRTAPPSSLIPRDEPGRMLGVEPSSEVDTVDLLRAISTREAPKTTAGKERNGAGLSASVIGNGALQKVTPVSAPTPRKAPGTPRASRSGVGARGKKR